MKKLFATIFVLLSFSFCNKLLAVHYSDGYIIRKGDTTFCKIRTPQTIQGFCQECLQKSILTKDSTGKETNYLATEIEGFGFTEGNEKIMFLSKSLPSAKEPIFMQVVVVGKKLFLYSFMGKFYVDNNLLKSYPLRNYMLEDDKNRTVVFENGSLDNGRHMKAFFSDQPELLALYKQKRPNFYEMPDFVSLVNTKF